MKHFKILMAMLISFAAVTTLNAETKRYEVKSGIIEYAITESGNMMGITTETKGTAKTVFKDWGNVELQSEESTTTTMGQKEHEKESTKIDNGKVFVVNFDQTVIYEYTPALLAQSEHKDLVKTGKEMLASVGAKKIGEENFMGYTCEIWQVMHAKLWIYKGIMLKTVSEIMGMKHTTVATKIALDESISEDDLKLPNFPIKKATAQMLHENEDEDVPQITPEQMEQMKKMMNNYPAK